MQAALKDRSWNWLAQESGVPQSTLATQLGKPKFSVDVLVRVSVALGKDIAYFLPDFRSEETKLCA